MTTSDHEHDPRVPRIVRQRQAIKPAGRVVRSTGLVPFESRHRGYASSVMVSPHHGAPRDPSGGEVPLSLQAGFALCEFSIEQLWTSHVALGGNLPLSDLDAAVLGTGELADHDHDVVAQALNERLMDQGYANHPVAYASRMLRGD
jgi:hypothetical protein